MKDLNKDLRKVLLKGFALLVGLFWINLALAEEFKIKRVFRDINDVRALERNVRDVNDQQCALIKVKTDLDKLTFDCSQGFATNPEYPTAGEIWLFVSPLEKRIKIRKTGFLPLDVELPEPAAEGAVYVLEVSSDPSLMLNSGRGTVMISSIPTGAQVSIDGIPGSERPSPAVFRDFEARPYRFKISNDRYNPFDTIIKIEDQRSSEVTIKLVPQWGGLIANVNPPDALVKIDDKTYNHGYGKLNLTTIQDALNLGTYNLEVSKTGYYTQKQNITLFPDSVTVVSVALDTIFGTLDVTSNPLGANVFVVDKLIGTTPLQKKMMVGDYSIFVRKEGYASADFTTTIQENTVSKKFVELPETIDIEINTSPERGVVTLNGVLLKGRNPIKVKANPGRNRIVIEKDGYETLDSEFVVTETQKSYMFNLMLAKHAITIETTPDNVSVQVDDGQTVSTPGTVKLIKGNYDLSLSQRGYMSRKVSLTVRDDDKTVGYVLRPAGVVLLGFSWSKDGVGGNLSIWGGHVATIIDIQAIKEHDDDPYPAPEQQGGIQAMFALGLRMNFPIPLSVHAGYGLRALGYDDTTDEYDRTFYSPVFGATLPVSFAGGKFWVYGQANYWLKTETGDPNLNFTAGLGWKI